MVIMMFHNCFLIIIVFLPFLPTTPKKSLKTKFCEYVLAQYTSLNRSWMNGYSEERLNARKDGYYYHACKNLFPVSVTGSPIQRKCQQKVFIAFCGENLAGKKFSCVRGHFPCPGESSSLCNVSTQTHKGKITGASLS